MKKITIKKKNPKGGPRGFTIEIIAEALKANGCFVSDTARALGISIPTLHERIKNSEELQKVMIESEIEISDLAIKQLVKNIKKGDQRAIEYFLNKKAVFYGYAEISKELKDDMPPMPTEPEEVFVDASAKK